MQAVYYPLSDMKVQTGERICVISNHDEYSLWFDVTGKEKRYRIINEDSCIPYHVIFFSAVSQVEMPHPMCGVHLVVSRTRLGQMNDVERNFKYLSCLRKMLSACSTSCPIVLCLGELSLLPLLAAACGAVAITREQNKHMRALLETVARINGFSSRLVLLDSSASLSSITEKVSEVKLVTCSCLSLLLLNRHFTLVLHPVKQYGKQTFGVGYKVWIARLERVLVLCHVQFSLLC